MNKNMEYGRHLLLQIFERFIEEHNIPSDLNVLIIGGSNDEPELEILRNKGLDLNLTLYGIEEYETYFDMNKQNDVENNSFDFLICSNVLEHVWNIENFFENIKNLTNENTLVFINCPKSNMEHGSPEYYSAGYPKEFLIKNLENKNFIILEAGEVGSERFYKSIHLLQTLYTKEEIESKYRFKNNSMLSKLKHLAKLYNLGHYLSLTRSSNSMDKSAFMTNSYVFAKKAD